MFIFFITSNYCVNRLKNNFIFLSRPLFHIIEPLLKVQSRYLKKGSEFRSFYNTDEFNENVFIKISMIFISWKAKSKQFEGFRRLVRYLGSSYGPDLHSLRIRLMFPHCPSRNWNFVSNLQQIKAQCASLLTRVDYKISEASQATSKTTSYFYYFINVLHEIFSFSSVYFYSASIKFISFCFSVV